MCFFEFGRAGGGVCSDFLVCSVFLGFCCSSPSPDFPWFFLIPRCIKCDHCVCDPGLIQADSAHGRPPGCALDEEWESPVFLFLVLVLFCFV